MKILHICTGWPLSYKGGITNYVRSLAQIQYENGQDVYVMGAPDDNKYEFNYIEYESKEIKPFTYTPLEDKEALAKIKCVLEKENFDIIHVHAIEYVDWDLYTILHKYHYVVSLHDYCFICARIYMYSNRFGVCNRYDEKKCSKCVSYLDRYGHMRGIVARLNNKFSLKLDVPHLPQNITTIRYQKFSQLLNGSDYILPVSKKVEEIFRNSGITAKSKVLHIGNDSADHFKNEIVYNSNPHTMKIVFLGRLTDYKGGFLFLKIAEHYKNNPNIEFHFLGNSAEFSEKLKVAGIIDEGKYNPKDLSKLLENYDLGMVLSIWHDNGPQVVMELLNNRIPVIGTRMGGIPDFVNSDNGFLFDPYSQTEIENLYDFLDHLTPEKVLSLKKNIKPTTTPKQHYCELMKVYQEVLDNK